MRLIPILGLVFFLKYLYINCSYRALLIIANGLLCHGLKPKISNNESYSKEIQYLRTYDTICNILMILYTIYICPITIVYASIGTITFLVEIYLEKTNGASEKTRDIIHVIGVHIPLSNGLARSFI